MCRLQNRILPALPLSIAHHVHMGREQRISPYVTGGGRRSDLLEGKISGLDSILDRRDTEAGIFMLQM